MRLSRQDRTEKTWDAWVLARTDSFMSRARSSIRAQIGWVTGVRRGSPKRGTSAVAATMNTSAADLKRLTIDSLPPILLAEPRHYKVESPCPSCVRRSRTHTSGRESDTRAPPEIGRAHVRTPVTVQSPN